MRNMSFALTTQQFINKSKTVTRRFGWKFLKKGDLICGVEKAMGLQKGEKIKRLGVIRIISNDVVRLDSITQDDVIKEGFPNWKPADFINLITKHYNVKSDSMINRIEFEYV